MMYRAVNQPSFLTFPQIGKVLFWGMAGKREVRSGEVRALLRAKSAIPELGEVLCGTPKACAKLEIPFLRKGEEGIRSGTAMPKAV